MLTIDPAKLEAAITENTQAILATHVFGNPCDVEAIQEIAEKHNLKVIYDAAHCFAVTYKGKSIFEYGDVISTSFHATKLFHTGEGGAIFVPNDALYKKCYYHHNFGHNGPLDYHGLGVNAKASEMQAAMGLSVLPYIDTIIAKRKLLTETYETLLKDNPHLSLFEFREFAEKNYSYMPVIFKDEAHMHIVLEKLAAVQIFPRRYFYPSLNKLPYLDKSVSMPISEDICSKILCLPLYFELEKQQVVEICSIINSL